MRVPNRMPSRPRIRIPLNSAVQPSFTRVPGPRLAADPDPDRRTRVLGLRAIRYGPDLLRGLVALLAALLGASGSVAHEGGSRRKPPTPRPRQNRRPSRSPRMRILSTSASTVASRPTTWSSIPSRHSKPGPPNTAWAVRPTRPRPSSSKGWGKPGPSSTPTLPASSPTS